MNRRGQVYIILLVLVALFLAVVAIFGFFSFNKDFNGISKDMSEMVMELDFNQRYVAAETDMVGREVAEKCQGCSVGELKKKFVELAADKDVEYGGAGNLFSEIEGKNFDIVEGKTGYEITFNNKLFVSAKRGRSSIVRYFELKREIEKIK